MTKVRSPRLISVSKSHELKRSGQNEESMVARYDDKNSTVHAKPGPCPMLTNRPFHRTSVDFDRSEFFTIQVLDDDPSC